MKARSQSRNGLMTITGAALRMAPRTVQTLLRVASLPRALHMNCTLVLSCILLHGSG